VATPNPPTFAAGKEGPRPEAGRVVATDELSALVKTLVETGQRLEELTAGEVDAVADPEGRTFLLQRAQEQLRHSEAAKRAAILNALPAHIALIDTQGIIVAVNESWRQFGRSSALHGPGHRVGLNYLEICDGAGADAAAEARRIADGIRSVLSGQAKSFSIEYACGTPTAPLWFLMTATPLADDRTNGAVVMHLDVTAQRHTEASLRDSESRFRQMADNISDVFFLREADGSRMLYVSPAYEKIWGRSRESLYSNPASWGEAVHPEDRAVMRERHRQGGRTGKYEVEFRIVRPDGSIRWIETKGFPVRDDAGRTVRIAGVAEDITERKQAAESERRFSDVLANVELVSLMLDGSARITYCNDYLLQLTGWQREEVMGRDWLEVFVPPADITGMREAFAALIAGQPAARHHENDILTRSGERRLIRWSNSVLRSGSGEVIGTASIGEDITARKLADEVLGKRAAELERFHRLSVGRELQMVELKKQVNELARQAGQVAPHDLAFLEPKPKAG
jgi:PAS domain S-box-containing protein